MPPPASLQVMGMRHGACVGFLEHSKGCLALPALQAGSYRTAARLGRDTWPGHWAAFVFQ